MEKYGVKTSADELLKQGSAVLRCPKCSSVAERHGEVIKCPHCGTQPFEGSGRTHGEESNK